MSSRHHAADCPDTSRCYSWHRKRYNRETQQWEPLLCAGCGEPMHAARSDAKTATAACRKRLSRKT